MMWHWAKGKLDRPLYTQASPENVRLASDAELLKLRNTSGAGSDVHVWCEAELTRRAQWRQGLPSWCAVAISLASLAVAVLALWRAW